MSLKAVSTSSQTYLDWTQRPADLQKKINDDFAKSEKEDFPIPFFAFSESQFALFNLDEFLLLKKTILEAYPAQKEFNVLHIGARDFTWSRALSKFIEKQTDLPKDIKINIYGIRGERHLKERIVHTDRCTLYNLGAFKVEELFAKFKENGFDLENKVDLAISYLYLRRLNDPVGTLVQAYNLLRPKSGWLLIDGFFFLCNNETMESVDGNRRMTQLFVDMKAPFLTNKFDHMRSLNHFMLKRPDDKPCRLPMSYSGSYHFKDDQEAQQWQIDSSHVTRFQRKPQSADRESFILPREYGVLSGDKPMFDGLLKIEKLFFGPFRDYWSPLPEKRDSWSPLTAKDEHYVWTPLQTAVANGEYDRVREILDERRNADEKCLDGSWKNTALHLSVQKMGAPGEKRYEIFKMVLKHTENINACNIKGHTPLHETIILKNDRAFHDLIVDGAYIHDQHPSVMTCAMEVRNMNAVKFLFKQKVEMSEAEKEKLNGPAFIELREFMLEQEGISPQALQN